MPRYLPGRSIPAIANMRKRLHLPGTRYPAAPCSRRLAFAVPAAWVDAIDREAERRGVSPLWLGATVQGSLVVSGTTIRKNPATPR